MPRTPALPCPCHFRNSTAIFTSAGRRARLQANYGYASRMQAHWFGERGVASIPQQSVSHRWRTLTTVLEKLLRQFDEGGLMKRYQAAEGVYKRHPPHPTPPLKMNIAPNDADLTEKSTPRIGHPSQCLLSTMIIKAWYFSLASNL